MGAAMSKSQVSFGVMFRMVSGRVPKNETGLGDFGKPLNPVWSGPGCSVRLGGSRVQSSWESVPEAHGKPLLFRTFGMPWRLQRN